LKVLAILGLPTTFWGRHILGKNKKSMNLLKLRHLPVTKKLGMAYRQGPAPHI
jgi:hypothetical protein